MDLFLCSSLMVNQCDIIIFKNMKLHTKFLNYQLFYLFYFRWCCGSSTWDVGWKMWQFHSEFFLLLGRFRPLLYIIHGALIVNYMESILRKIGKTLWRIIGRGTLRHVKSIYKNLYIFFAYKTLWGEYFWERVNW